MKLSISNITIPNILSSYRILVFPLLLFFIFSGAERLFALFLVINLISDILDGLIARTFNMKTAIGARLDSIGDIGTYIAAICGVAIFKWQDLSTNITPFYVFIGMYTAMYIVSFIKFRKVPSLHLYTFKTAGYIQGIFFAVLFLDGFYLWLYYLAMAWGLVAIVEEILVLLVLKSLESDVKGNKFGQNMWYIFYLLSWYYSVH